MIREQEGERFWDVMTWDVLGAPIHPKAIIAILEPEDIDTRASPP